MDVYNEILNFLGQQNFALVNTNAPKVTILRNNAEGTEIFCVLLDNADAASWGAAQIQMLNEKLIHFGGRYNDVLFILVTDDVQRDKSLADIYGVRLWIAGVFERCLYVYENQPEDFYGLRFGIEETVAGEIYPEKGRSSKRPGKNLKGKDIPYATIALIIINVAYFVLIVTQGRISDTEYMLKMGANYGVYVFEKGQIWRLATSMFVHFGFSHLAGNMFYLGVAGYNLEKTAGHVKFLLIYLLSGIGANLISAGYYYLTASNTISAGASGAVYGLIGAMVFITFKNRGRIRSPQLFLRIGIIIVFLYYSNFTETGVDTVAHIAGFIIGLVLSIFLIGGANPPRRKKA